VNRLPKGWDQKIDGATYDLKTLIRDVHHDCAGKPEDEVADAFLATINAAVFQVERAPTTNHVHVQGGVLGKQ